MLNHINYRAHDERGGRSKTFVATGCSVHQTANRIVAIGLLTAAAGARDRRRRSCPGRGVKGGGGCPSVLTHARDPGVYDAHWDDVVLRVPLTVRGEGERRSRFRRLWAWLAPCQLQSAIPHHRRRFIIISGIVRRRSSAGDHRRSSATRARGHPPGRPRVSRRGGRLYGRRPPKRFFFIFYFLLYSLHPPLQIP